MLLTIVVFAGLCALCTALFLSKHSVSYRVNKFARGSTGIPKAPCTTTGLVKLQKSLSSAFSSERKEGITINNTQDPDSFARLDDKVRQVLGQYCLSQPKDWKTIAMWNDVKYTRQQIFASEDFEILLLCWKEGQFSDVHSHGDSHCWLTTLQGPVEEHQYSIGDCKPCHIKTRPVDVHQTAYINDFVALHAVGSPLMDISQGAVTLHVYAPPLRKMKVYNKEDVVEETAKYDIGSLSNVL